MTDTNPGQDIVLPRQSKSFTAFLAEQNGGKLVNELSDVLRELTEDIENYFANNRGKVQGELLLKVKLTLEKGMYKVDIDYGTKRPKALTTTTMMWLGRDGNLQPNDPRQGRLPFGEVPRRV